MNDFKKNKKILYIVDMINGFVKEGALHDKHIKETVPEQIKLIEYFKESCGALAFIKDTHDKNCKEFENFPVHCVKGTSEAEVIEELQRYEREAASYEKNSTNAIFAPNMLNNIEEMEELKEVVGCGCCTDICVLNFLISLKNYFDQKNRNVAVFVVKEATDTYHADEIHDRNYYNEIAYKLMEQAGIIIVNNCEELKEKEKEL